MRQQAHRPARPPQVACSIWFLFGRVLESDCNSLVAEVLVLPLSDRRTDQSRLASGDGDV